MPNARERDGCVCCVNRSLKGYLGYQFTLINDGFKLSLFISKRDA